MATALMRAPKIDVSARHFAAEEQSTALRQVIQVFFLFFFFSFFLVVIFFPHPLRFAHPV
jgi:hypothetical protein